MSELNFNFSENPSHYLMILGLAFAIFAGYDVFLNQALSVIDIVGFVVSGIFIGVGFGLLWVVYSLNFEIKQQELRILKETKRGGK